MLAKRAKLAHEKISRGAHGALHRRTHARTAARPIAQRWRICGPYPWTMLKLDANLRLFSAVDENRRGGFFSWRTLTRTLLCTADQQNRAHKMPANHASFAVDFSALRD